MQAIDALARVEDAQATSTPGAFASFFGPDPFGLLCVVILTSLGTWGLPQMVQKFYAIKDEKSIGKGTLISTIFAIIVAGGCYFLGGFGRLYDIDIAAQGYDAIIPAMIEKLSPLLIAVVVILVLSASMSTLSSLVLASSSTLTLDMIRGTIVKEMTEKKQVFIMRIFIVVFIAISAVIAVVQYKSGVTFIAQLMGISWGALAGAFPCTVYLQPVLEGRDEGCRACELPVRQWHHGSEYARKSIIPNHIAVADQLWCICNACRTSHRAGCEPYHTEAFR